MTEQIHIAREGSRIGLVASMQEAAQLVQELQQILDTWPLRRQVEREHDARLTGSQR